MTWTAIGECGTVDSKMTLNVDSGDHGEDDHRPANCQHDGQAVLDADRELVNSH